MIKVSLSEEAKIIKDKGYKADGICPICRGYATYHKMIDRFRCNSFYVGDKYKHSCGWFTPKEMKNDKPA